MSPFAAARLVLVMVLWAACFPLIVIGFRFAPHLSFATLRAVIAAAALLALAVVLRRPFPHRPGLWAHLVAIGFGATFLGFLGMFHAAEFIAPGLATVIANTQPLLAAALAHAVLNERLDRRRAAGLAMGFAGIVVVAAPGLLGSGETTRAIGVAYIGLAALGITVSNVLLKRVAGQVDPLVATGLQIGFGSVPLALTAALTEAPLEIAWTPPFVLTLLALALPGTALAYWLWMSLLERVPLGRANAFSFLVPFLGIAAGVTLFGERVGWLEALGIALTLAGLARVLRSPGAAPGTA